MRDEKNTLSPLRKLLDSSQPYRRSMDATRQVTPRKTPSVHASLPKSGHEINNKPLSRRIQRYSKILITKIKHSSKKLWQILQPLLRKLWKLTKSLPWKLITPIIIILLLLIFTVFHYYLAAPTRILNTIESNYDSSLLLEEEILKSTAFLNQIPPYATDVSEAEAGLSTVGEAAKKSSVSLPPRFFANYAFRNDAQKSEQLDTLYTASEAINATELQLAANQSNELLQLAKRVFESDIESNTQSYINQLKDTKRQLESERFVIQTDTFRRIIQQVLDSAEQYQLTIDIDNFNQQTNNVASELYKVVYQSWSDYTESTQSNLSAFRSSTESIINQ